MKLDANLPLFDHYKHRGTRVFCEDVEVMDCVMADDVVGVVQNLHRDKNGAFELDPDEGGWTRDTHIGTVCIILPMGPPPLWLVMHDWLKQLA